MSTSHIADINSTVISINVSRPQELIWNGATVRTSILKKPVHGAVAVSANGFDGDGVGDPEVHGGPTKCVFLYPAEHYEYWREWLGGSALPYGSLGENLTVRGLGEDDVAIGDRFGIGSAEFVVTEPRQPCWKVDIGVGRAGGIAEMIRNGRIGFYLGLTKPGQVTAGDTLHYLGGPTDTDRHSPALVHRLNTHAGVEDVELLETVAATPGLAGSAADLLMIKARGLRRRRERESTHSSWVGARDFVVDQRTEEAPAVVSVTLRPADGEVLPDVRPGQFISIALGPDRLIRQYTLSGVTAPSTWRITVRRQHDEPCGSSAVHALSVGDTVQLTAPGGNFCLPEQLEPANYLLVSAGIGITPILAMARDWVTRPAGRLTVLHGMRSGQDNALFGELCATLAGRDDAEVWSYVSDGSPCTVPAHEWAAGRIGSDAIGRAVVDPAKTHAYICGPTVFMEDLTNLLIAAGVDAAAVHIEKFAPALGALPTAVVPAGGIEVMFAQASHTGLWADGTMTLLDLGESMGADIPASCREGRCGTCLTGVLSGEVTHLVSPSFPVPDGMCLPCISVPTTRLLLDA